MGRRNLERTLVTKVHISTRLSPLSFLGAMGVLIGCDQFLLGAQNQVWSIWLILLKKVSKYGMMLVKNQSLYRRNMLISITFPAKEREVPLYERIFKEINWYIVVSVKLISILCDEIGLQGGGR